MIKRKHGFHVAKEKKVVRYYMEEGMEGKWIFYRERNGQEGGEEICLASIDLGAAAVDSEALNNTAQRLVL